MIVFITHFSSLHPLPFFFWLCLVILVPQPGIEPTLEAWNLDHRTTREVLHHVFFLTKSPEVILK